MSLELTPQTERRVSEYAAERHISADEAVNRLLRFAVNPRQAAHEETDRVQILLSKWQNEYGLPVLPGSHKSLAELSTQWAEEDALLTEEERQADRQFWEDFNRRERQYISI